MKNLFGYLIAFSLLLPLGNLLIAAPASAQDLRASDISPIMSFKERSKRLKEECRGQESTRICEQKRKELDRVLKELRAICIETPDDDRCGAIKRQQPVNRLKQFCFENPFEYKCVRKRELEKFKAKRKRKFCARNPEASKCKSKAHKRKAYLTFAERCKLYPKNARCIDRKKKEKRFKPDKEPESNAF